MTAAAPAGEWLRDRSAAAGFANLNAMGKAIGVGTAPYSWSEGARPLFGLMRPLADALGVGERELFRELWGEVPGDPCDCGAGCGGVKVAPEAPRSLRLRVDRACARCGRLHHYPVPSTHSRLCSPCTVQTRRRSSDNVWLRTTARRAGYANMTALATAIEAEPPTAIAWSRGTKPSGKWIVALADVLGVSREEAIKNLWGEGLGTPCLCGCSGVKVFPDEATAYTFSVQIACTNCGALRTFHNAVSAHRDRCKACAQVGRRLALVRMACATCGRVKGFRPATLRAGIKHGKRRAHMIDWVTSVGVQPECLACHARSLGRRLAARKIKRHGRKALVEAGRRLAASRTPEQRAESLLRAQEARRGSRMTAVQRARVARGAMRARTEGRFGLCRLCNQLCYKRDPRPGDLLEVHQQCLRRWRVEGRERAHRLTYPPRPRGQRPTADSLMTSYEMAIRHWLRGVTVDELATEFAADPRSIARRVRRFIDVLPNDDRGGGELLRRATRLREVSG